MEGEFAMKRTTVALGILGLVWATVLPASAQKTIKLFGTTYSVAAQSRAQTYANGVKIKVPDSQNKYGYAYYSEGATPADDRLWIVDRVAGGLIGDNADTEDTGDQIYYLQGVDATGAFTPAVSKATSFFGGNASDRWHGRRPISVMEINRDNTGVKKDRNVIATTFMDDDSIRMWDEDTMSGFGGSSEDADPNGAHGTDALYERVHGGVSPSTGDVGENAADPNQPSGSHPVYAPLPTPDGHTIIVAAGPHGDTATLGLCIWDTAKADPTKDDAIDLTETGVVTKDATKKFPDVDSSGTAWLSQSIAKYSGSGNVGEYWILLNEPEAGGDQHDTPRTDIMLVRATFEVPSDLTKNTANSIKVTVLDTQDILAEQDGVLSTAGTAGVLSVAVGREVPGSNGKKMLYATDYDGNLYTLTPQP
jgi:hypothetical protein